jgi:hypothetical protein
MALRTIYFHEDDSLQIEILPIANWQFCLKELRAIEDFSEKHRVPDGMGWSDMYGRSEPDTPTSSLLLDYDAISIALAAHLTPIERYRSTRAFGMDANSLVYVTAGKLDVVERIGLVLNGNDESRRRAWLKSFEALGSFGKMLLVDWCWGRLYALDDVAALEGYLNEKQQLALEIAEELRKMRAAQATAAPWWKFWESADTVAVR